VAYISTSQPHKRRRAATNKQPRGKQLPAVISEFKQYQHSDSRLGASNKCLKFLRSGSDGGEPAKEFEFELALTIISMLESSPKQYANQIFNKVRELSKPVHGA